MASNAYFGKYRAIVAGLDDPEERGRIRVECPRVLGDGMSAWCEPCSPVAYDGGGDFCLPKIGDAVWVEFEGGSPQQPIWVGGWWGEKKTPLDGYGGKDSVRVIEYGGAKIVMSGGKITITGDVAFEGKISAPGASFDEASVGAATMGSASVGGKDVASHTHTAQGERAETTGPN
jgi:hypothetical protein